MDVPSTLPLPLSLPLPLLIALALLLHIVLMLLAGVGLQGRLGLAAVIIICRQCCEGVWELVQSGAVEVRVTKSRGC